jgi:hypothetical protein
VKKDSDLFVKFHGQRGGVEKNRYENRILTEGRGGKSPQPAIITCLTACSNYMPYRLQSDCNNYMSYRLQ